MPRIDINFLTEDRKLVFDLLDTKTAGIGQRAKILGNATIECTEWRIQKAFGIPEILSFVVDSAITIDLGLLSTWLYDKVKHRKIERLTINRREVVDFTENGIRCVLEETITQEKS